MKRRAWYVLGDCSITDSHIGSKFLCDKQVLINLALRTNGIAQYNHTLMLLP